MNDFQEWMFARRCAVRIAALLASIVGLIFVADRASAGDFLKELGDKTGVNGALNEGQKVISGLGSAVEGALKDSAKVTRTAVGDAVTTAQVAGGGALAVVQKAGTDVVAVHTKAWSDGAAQTQKGLTDTVEAGEAIVRYQARQLDAQGEALRNANARTADGKIVDAAWGLSTEPLQAQERNFFKATQESSLINQGAATAAAAYGGPGGAAAYASWQTYRTTGDPELALRAGILSGIQSQAGGAVMGMPSGTTGELVKKSIMAGAVGGLAVAASGGDDQAVRDGFIRSGGAVLVQGGQDRLKAYSPDAADAIETAHCISAQGSNCLEESRYARNAKGHLLYDKNGSLLFDTAKYDPEKYKASWLATTTPPEAAAALGAMKDVGKLPDTEAIPILNNEWVVSWKLDPSGTAAYGTPQVVMTYVGESPPFRNSTVYKTNSTPKEATPSRATRDQLLYICRLKPGPERTISLRMSRTGCVATYRRQAGPQTIWRSEHNPTSCMGQVRKFVATDLKSKGIACSPVRH